jgi:hypothetical protein
LYKTIKFVSRRAAKNFGIHAFHISTELLHLVIKILKDALDDEVIDLE